jgi:photosystem II stability/assembly factor-like uncharacterized protein
LLLVAACGAPAETEAPLLATPSPSTAHSDRVPLEPLFSPADASFLDAEQGWALGRICTDGGECASALKVTSDGGQSWETRAAPPTGGSWWPPGSDLRQVQGVTRLRFADGEHGWAFGSDLFVTGDGGVSWSHDDRLGHVLDLAAEGASVWAIADECSGEADGLCLLVSSDFGRRWEIAPGAPRIVSSNVQIVRSGPRDGWVASSGRNEGVLTATHDGGRTWEERPFSCCLRQFRLAAGGGSKLWVIYGGVGAGMNQPKWLYVSLDGGQTWQPSKEPGTFGNAPEHGRLMDLAAASDERAFIADVRGPFSMTSDGGQSWRMLFREEFDRSPGLRVTFVDEQHGWAISTLCIWRTVDGGETWEALLF